MGRYNRKKDSNQNSIVTALERAGCAVTDKSTAGEGFPDIICSRAGHHYLLEIKSSRGKLTAPQVEFHKKHTPVHIVRTIDEALRAVGLIA